MARRVVPALQLLMLLLLLPAALALGAAAAASAPGDVDDGILLSPSLRRRVVAARAARDRQEEHAMEEFEAEFGEDDRAGNRVTRASVLAGYPPDRRPSLSRDHPFYDGFNLWSWGSYWGSSMAMQKSSRRERGLPWLEWLDRRLRDGSNAASLQSLPDAGLCDPRPEGDLRRALKPYCDYAFRSIPPPQALLARPNPVVRVEWALGLQFLGEHQADAEGKITRILAKFGIERNGDFPTPNEFGQGNFNFSPYHPAALCSVFSVTAWKLGHDSEQLVELVDSGRLPAPFAAASGVVRSMIPIIDKREPADRSSPTVFPTSMLRQVAGVYGRLLWEEPSHQVWAGEAGFNGETSTVSHNPLDNRTDWDKAEERYYQTEFEQGHGVSVVDSVLSSEALQALLDYTTYSTIYFESKPGMGQYSGAYFFDSFNAPIYTAIADTLRKAMPNVIGNLPLANGWSYKYGPVTLDDEFQEGRGIRTHADSAYVNVNLWLTPPDALEDPDGGGLVVYQVLPPENSTFMERNSFDKSGSDDLQAFLDTQGNPTRVAYKQNRAMLFHSDLYHRTDTYKFKKGYRNRRINVTFLFGYAIRRSADSTMFGLVD